MAGWQIFAKFGKANERNNNKMSTSIKEQILFFLKENVTGEVFKGYEHNR